MFGMCSVQPCCCWLFVPMSHLSPHFTAAKLYLSHIQIVCSNHHANQELPIFIPIQKSDSFCWIQTLQAAARAGITRACRKLVKFSSYATNGTPKDARTGIGKVFARTEPNYRSDA